MAMRWRDIGSRWFHVFNLPAIAALAFLIPLVVAMSKDVLPPGSYAGWQLALTGARARRLDRRDRPPLDGSVTAFMRSCSRHC